MVDAFHACVVVVGVFEDGREVVDCVGVEAHLEAEDPGCCDEGVEMVNDNWVWRAFVVMRAFVVVGLRLREWTWMVGVEVEDWC